MITNDDRLESEGNRKFGNNILNIDNSKNKSTSLINNRLNKCNDYSSKTALNNGITKYDKLNGASDLKADNFDTTSIKKVSSSLLNTTLSTNASTKHTSNQQTSSGSGKKVLNTAVALHEETSPQLFECKPQSSQQQYNSSSKLSSSLSKNQLNSKVGSKKRSLKSFFKFSSSSKKKSSKLKSSSSTNKSTNLKNLKLQTDLNLSRSSLTNNQDCAVDSFIVDTFIDPAKLPQTSVTVSSESADAFLKTKKNDSKLNTNETSVLFVQNSSINKLNNFYPNKLNNKISTTNNSPNYSHNSQPSIKENSSTSSILPFSQSSLSSSPNSNLNNYSSNIKPSKLASSNFTNTKTLSATENPKYQFDLLKKSFDSASSEHIVNHLSNHNLSDLSASEHLLTKTASSATTKLNQQNSKIKKNLPSFDCLNCGDHLNQLDNLNYNFAKNSMSNGSNAAAAAIQMQQNADAYLSQLSAQQLNQLIMDQAFIPQNNTSNSTQSNSLSNHGNGTNNTVFDSESSEQFKRLLCRKCRPNRTGIVQHSHNSGSKFARNLHNSAMNMHPRNGWSAIKDLSKGSIKRLKRHQKRLTSYARAMRKHHLNNSGSSGGLTSGDLSDNVHQAALANMVINAMNTNKLNGYNNSSSNFCKECYLERILTHQNNGGLVNDYQQPNKNTTCLSCYNNLNNAFSMLNSPNYDLPPPAPPLPTQKLTSSYKSDTFLDPIDRFWDVKKFDVESWRNKLHKERLRKKERNVLMVVSSIAIVVFIGISYFGTILFLRLTRLQNEEQ